MATYNAHIASLGGGKFIAVMGEYAVTAADPEHDLCHALAQAGLPDGSIQFWRDGVRTLFHRSIHRMGGYRITLGESFPQRVKRGEGLPESLNQNQKGSARTGEMEPPAILVANSPANQADEVPSK